jgi:hypothetical protein
MAKLQVIQGQLLRHKDYSVRAYAGDVVADSDSCIAHQSNVEHVTAITATGAAASPAPVDDVATSDGGPTYIGPAP